MNIMNKKISMFALLLSMFLAVSACSTTANTNIVVAVNANSNANTEPAGTPSSGSAESQTASPEALVADLYKQHDANKSPFFQTKNRALVDKYFTKSTADLIWKDAVSSKGEVGALDGDPLYAAQDTQIKNFAIGKAELKGENATVPVNFTNYDKKTTIKFQLKMVAAAWKIDDIIWPEGDSMVKIIKENYAGNTDMETKSGGNFEGKYQVGDTSCTVKPVKMAFEVRWAKGTGTEMVFFKEGTTFESDRNKEGGTDMFAFDDEKYNSGTFTRSDGKTFPIKRAK